MDLAGGPTALKHMMTIFLLACSLFVPVFTSGDHLPKNKVAEGSPETKMAGIIIEKTRLEEIVKSYGDPL